MDGAYARIQIWPTATSHESKTRVPALKPTTPLVASIISLVGIDTRGSSYSCNYVMRPDAAFARFMFHDT